MSKAAFKRHLATAHKEGRKVRFSAPTWAEDQDRTIIAVKSYGMVLGITLPDGDYRESDVRFKLGDEFSGDGKTLTTDDFRGNPMIYTILD